MLDPLTLVKALYSTTASLLRVDRGIIVKGNRKKPKKKLILFDAEYCPYCRHVREALTELDLDALIYPIPKGGKRYRPHLKRMGGDGKIPFLVDPNTETHMGDSEAIVEYLYSEYALEGEEPPGRRIYTSLISSVTRMPTGSMYAVPSKAPKKPLELWSFEASPYGRLARETFSEMEIKYILHNVGKTPGHHADYYPPEIRYENMPNYMPGTENRRNFIKRAGRVQIPFIVDPNTGVEMFETKDIQEYLRETYGA